MIKWKDTKYNPIKDLKDYQKKINTSPTTLPELPPEVVENIVKLLRIHKEANSKP